MTKGLLFMRLNRGQQLGTSCGMILSGVPGVGKSTAIRALGRTVERAYRARNPQMTDAVPVVYITMPTGQHPKALPAELLYFLGAPHAARATETALTHQACQLMTDLRTSLVIVDEVHEIDRSRASHDQQSDQLKYFMDHVPATFVLAGINVENCGFFTGHRGHQLARRFTPLKASPSNYSTIPQRQDWAKLLEGFERALRLHEHKPGSLLPLADYLYGRTGGYIVSLSHLMREAAIKAILTGTERIDEELLETVELDHAATQEASAQRQTVRKNCIPELTTAQRRLDKMAMRRGPWAAMRAYELASGYLQHSWRIDYHPRWYPALMDWWQQRVRAAGALPVQTTWQLPGWAVHPECTTLAAVFASPHWAALAVPTPRPTTPALLPAPGHSTRHRRWSSSEDHEGLRSPPA